MSAAYLYDGIRTPFGRHGGALAGVRPDDLAAHVVRELLARSPELDPGRIGDVLFGAANGSMDTCIALRTALVRDGVMYAQAGAGVVYDSDPAAEYQETINKARALVRAAEEAVRFAGGGR